jgi:DNA helicase-2/ATP-dependent DNA helicase PcrA
VDEAASTFRSSSHGAAATPSRTTVAGRQPDVRNLRRVDLSQPSPAPSAGAPASGGTLQAGQHIEHERFGQGEVLAVDGAGDNAKATIQFRNVGVKQLLLRFARFRVVD